MTPKLFVETYQKCSRCGIEKPSTTEFFHNRKGSPTGFNGKCKECRKGEHKRIYNTPEKRKRHNLRKRAYDLTKGYIKKLLKSYRQRDGKANRVCSITEDWIKSNIINKPCIYCGENDNLQIGVDRKDNSIGHTPENSVPACRVCNVVRSNIFTVEEMMVLGGVISGLKAKRRILKLYGRSDEEHFDYAQIRDKILSLCN